MSNQAADLVFDALGEPVRRRILELLHDGPTPVGRLAERLPVGRPAVSKHLRVLSNAGLIEHRSVGTRNLYLLAPDGMAAELAGAAGHRAGRLRRRSPPGQQGAPMSTMPPIRREVLVTPTRPRSTLTTQLNGFAVAAYLPARHITIAVTTTLGPRSISGHNYSTDLTRQIARYLAPGHPIS